MEITVRIPDELATRLGSTGEVERRVLETIALEEFKLGHLSKAELKRVLGFAVLDEIDGFLKAHGVFEPYSLADFNREQRALDQLGL
jgi:hypothetical protein